MACLYICWRERVILVKALTCGDAKFGTYLTRIVPWKNQPLCPRMNFVLVFIFQGANFDAYVPFFFFPPPFFLPFSRPETSYPNATWLIGNHSDELTPWIPFIASRTSYQCNYFVIPCCFFDFAGKFARNDTRIGKYKTYLNFVEDIGKTCGFEVEIDRLRIPSTKRMCHIGRTRTYKPEEEDKIDAARMNLLAGIESFVARPRIQEVRNGTHVEKSVLERIVHQTFQLLLEQDPAVEHIEGRTWRKGGSLPLSVLVTKIPADDLKALKAEHGGYQTILKNHCLVFVVKKGVVHIRNWANDHHKRSDKALSNRKKRLCWFHSNHPDGCPRQTKDCDYAHGVNDLIKSSS
eukprot:m.43201 g.43201  ORF g.43201 m.43201 type:complete len:349 (+) comp17101_c0_seq1:524-1570(+)